MLPATRLGCIGSAENVRRQMQRFEQLGIELILCKFIPTAENVRRIGEEIIAPMQARVTSLSMAG